MTRQGQIGHAAPPVLNLKLRARSVLARTCFTTGYFERRLRRPLDGCVVLMYHAIADIAGLDPSQVESTRARAVENFEAEMTYVSRALHPIPLSELTSRLQRRLPLPPNSVVVTFDDGYEDNYSLAYPLLQKLKIPATIFLATGHIDSGRAFWWDELAALLRQTSQRSLQLKSIDGRRTNGVPDELELGARREQTIREVAAWLRSLHPDEATRNLNLIAERVEAGGPTVTPKLLSWAAVREMHRGGIDFGAHTVSHPNLARLPLAAARAEIETSMHRIEDTLNTEVKSFAYPYGMADNYSPEVRASLAGFGLQGACTAMSGLASAQSDAFSVPRLSWSAGSVSLSAWRLHKCLP